MVSGIHTKNSVYRTNKHGHVDQFKSKIMTKNRSCDN